jgi:hypothetical protein
VHAITGIGGYDKEGIRFCGCAEKQKASAGFRQIRMTKTITGSADFQ